MRRYLVLIAKLKRIFGPHSRVVARIFSPHSRVKARVFGPHSRVKTSESGGIINITAIASNQRCLDPKHK